LFLIRFVILYLFHLQGPAAEDDFATTDEGVPIDIPVLDNDIDDDGDILTVTHVDEPANGSAEINPDGTVKYTPNPGFVGVDEPFEYKISDGNGGTASAFVIVTVLAVNHVSAIAQSLVSSSRQKTSNSRCCLNL